MISAGYSRRSFRVTVICRAPSMTWLLVTTMPSARTMTPEPTDWATRWRPWPRPNISKKGSRSRTSVWAEILTTAGAETSTTGAKEACRSPWVSGARRVGSASPPSWAWVVSGLPQADSISTAARAR